MEPITILLTIVLIAGFYLSFNIGANDVANTMGTSVGSRALKIKYAIFIAAIFEFLGAVLIGDEVSKTIKQGFVDPNIFSLDPMGFAYGMTAAILATAAWLQYATLRGLPVSTTHSIVGAVLGFAVVQGGFSHIKLSQIFAIFSTWLVSPVLGGLVSYFCLIIILRFIIDTYDPLKRAKIIVPIMIGFIVTLLSSSFTFKIASKIFVNNINFFGFSFCIILGFIFALVFYLYSRSFLINSQSRVVILTKIEKIFSRMQWVTACFLAFAHGSNDVANSIGPAASVISVIQKNTIEEQNAVPFWLLLMGAVGIVVGLLTFGRKVIYTVGKTITQITPTRGFAAEFGASLTILLGSALGIPVSTTHILVGSVIGVGLARGIGGIDLGVIKKIGRSWIITMPATAFISIVFCLLINFFRF